ncbi:hypothetical protein CR513_53051, partial [Mucuna pruriens]
MADTSSENEDNEEVNFNSLEYLQITYQELLSNSLTLSLKYKDLKRKFSKLSKDFKSLEKENSIFKKENEKLNEEQTNNLSKVNTSEVTELQKEVIDHKQIVEVHNKKLGRRSYDCGECPKGSFKPSRTNPKRSKKIWVPKTMIIHVAYVFNSRK